MYQVKSWEGFEGAFTECVDAIGYACELAAAFPPEQFRIENEGKVIATYQAHAPTVQS